MISDYVYEQVVAQRDALAADLDAAKRDLADWEPAKREWHQFHIDLTNEQRARAERAEAALAEARQIISEQATMRETAYRERDAAERKLDAARKALRHIEAQPDSPGAAAYMRAAARAALAAAPADTEEKRHLCGRCDGRGLVPDGHLMAPLIRCPDCGGTGAWRAPAAEEE